MKNINKLLFLIFLLPFFSVAQTNYQPGAVVNLKGDTIHGFINYREWGNNPKSILFKPESGAAPNKFTANDVQSFSVSVGYLAEYESYKGPISMDNVDIDKLMIGRDSSYKLDTVFLKVLQKGKNLTVFSYTDTYKVRYFINCNSSEQLKELVYRIYYNSAEENGSNRTSYENAFRSQLSSAAAKAGVLTEDLENDIAKAEYRENDILTIVSKINGISVTDPTKNNLSKPNPFNKTIAIMGIIAILAATIIAFAGIHQQH